jgi:hypothetical protein
MIQINKSSCPLYIVVQMLLPSVNLNRIPRVVISSHGINLMFDFECNFNQSNPPQLIDWKAKVKGKVNSLHV